MTCDECGSDHPSKEYYVRLGFDEAQAELIVEGFHADDYPTRREMLSE